MFSSVDVAGSRGLWHVAVVRGRGRERRPGGPGDSTSCLVREGQSAVLSATGSLCTPMCPISFAQRAGANIAFPRWRQAVSDQRPQGFQPRRRGARQCKAAARPGGRAGDLVIPLRVSRRESHRPQEELLRELGELEGEPGPRPASCLAGASPSLSCPLQELGEEITEPIQEIASNRSGQLRRGEGAR